MDRIMKMPISFDVTKTWARDISLDVTEFDTEKARALMFELRGDSAALINGVSVKLETDIEEIVYCGSPAEKYWGLLNSPGVRAVKGVVDFALLKKYNRCLVPTELFMGVACQVAAIPHGVYPVKRLRGRAVFYNIEEAVFRCSALQKTYPGGSAIFLYAPLKVSRARMLYVDANDCEALAWRKK